LERLDEVGDDNPSDIDLLVLIGRSRVVTFHLDVLLDRGLLRVDRLGRETGGTSGKRASREVEAGCGSDSGLECGSGRTDGGKGEVRDESGKVRELVRKLGDAVGG
jgi:DNA-binding transcriptional ArsR family regulator